MTNLDARDQLVVLGVLNSEGKPVVPVIHEVPSDPIYSTSLVIAREVTEGMLRAIQSPAMQGAIDVEEKPVGLVIAYHQFVWELLRYLENEKLISPPPVFSASLADPKHVRSSVFFVVAAPK